MSRVFFQTALETVATYWRIYRRDGVTLGFTTHDRDLWFGGICHQAAPGLLPSAIRRTASLQPDSAEIQGALTHDSINAEDIRAGRYDGAFLEAGVVDWENFDQAAIYSGEIGNIAREGNRFEAELVSVKTVLETDLVPRTSPMCRADFCGAGCGLSANRFTQEARITAVDRDTNRLTLNLTTAPSALLDGTVRWIDGTQAGQFQTVSEASAEGLLFDTPLPDEAAVGGRVLVMQGCDHSITTCHHRFNNAANFRGEPFLPGNDLMARYPVASA